MTYTHTMTLIDKARLVAHEFFVWQTGLTALVLWAVMSMMGDDSLHDRLNKVSYVRVWWWVDRGTLVSLTHNAGGHANEHRSRLGD